jgi:hypothetical protein
MTFAPTRCSPADTDGDRWMTLVELAEARGISKASAARLVRRHRWRRQTDNTRRVRAPGSTRCNRAIGRSGSQSCGYVGRCQHLGGHRDHSPLRPTLQDRTHLQAGGAADRLVFLPLLDVRHEAGAPPQGAINNSIASRSNTATPSNASSTPTTSSSRQVSYARDCFSIWTSPSLSSSGTRSAPGCSPFGPPSHPRRWSWPMPCVKACRNFS